MTDHQAPDIKRRIQDVARHEKPFEHEAIGEIAGYGVAALPALGELLAEDQPIDQAERLEDLLKYVLKRLMSGTVRADTALAIARFQQQLGLTCKYKSYAIKATTPLGFAVFLQTDGEGFSFQCHRTHKVEVFHIVEPQQNARVFLCPIDEWERIYDRDSFNAWLQGADDPRFERWMVRPEPGDVFVIDQLNVVHTVLGCVLEEYATVSTDMVDRLHDQNEGRAIPGHFTRDYARENLLKADPPASSRLVSITADGPVTRPLTATKLEQGSKTVLADFAVQAERFAVDADGHSPALADDKRAASLYVWGGSGSLVIGDAEDGRTLTVAKGDVLMLPAGVPYHFSAASDGLDFSRHRIEHEVAFFDIP